jgi:hypothetical protein
VGFTSCGLKGHLFQSYVGAEQALCDWFYEAIQHLVTNFNARLGALWLGVTARNTSTVVALGLVAIHPLLHCNGGKSNKTYSIMERKPI